MQLRSKHDAVKAHDDKLYGDWKSADYVFSDVNEKPSLVGRWDWHAWQLLLALIPAGIVYGIAQHARSEMAKDSKNPLLIDKSRPEQQEREAKEEHAALKSENAALAQRLSALEATIQELQKSLSTSKPADVKPTENSPNKKPPPTPPPAPLK